MKIQLLIGFMFFIISCSGQEIKITNGKIIDSKTNEPIRFAKITSNGLTTTSDFDGYYSFGKVQLDTHLINIICPHYKKQFDKVIYKADTLIIKMIPDTFDTELKAQITTKPTDTIYFKNSNIKQINYPRGEFVAFYENDKVRLISTRLINRIWYMSGQLKYQSIFYSSHMYKVTEWYKNGKLKAHGNMIWTNDKKNKEGSFMKSKNWKEYKN